MRIERKLIAFDIQSVSATDTKTVAALKTFPRKPQESSNIFFQFQIPMKSTGEAKSPFFIKILYPRDGGEGKSSFEMQIRIFSQQISPL